MQALQSFHRFQPGTNCRAWLTTILQNVRSNRRRARGRSPLVDDPDDRIGHATPFVPPVPQELTDEELLGALGRIPVVVSRSDRPLRRGGADVQGNCRRACDSAGNGDVTAPPRPRVASRGAGASTAAQSSAGRNLRQPMECRDVREMADSFLGEELLTETNHEILRHLDTCPVCRADLAGRRALREGVQRAFHRAPDLGPSPEFIAQLRTKLQDTAHQGSARAASDSRAGGRWLRRCCWRWRSVSRIAAATGSQRRVRLRVPLLAIIDIARCNSGWRRSRSRSKKPHSATAPPIVSSNTCRQTT